MKSQLLVALHEVRVGEVVMVNDGSRLG